MTNIDARLLAPGQLFIDPFGHVNTPIKAEGICIRNSPYVANEKVAVVELGGVRTDDGETTIKRVLDLGDQVELVPNQPAVYTSFDVASRTWAILIDTADSSEGVAGRLTLNVALNDATLFDGDPESDSSAWSEATRYLGNTAEPDAEAFYDSETDTEDEAGLADAWAERAMALEALLRRVLDMPASAKKGDRVRLSGKTLILGLDVEGATGTVGRIYEQEQAAYVRLDSPLPDPMAGGVLYVNVKLDQLTKIA